MVCTANCTEPLCFIKAHCIQRGPGRDLTEPKGSCTVEQFQKECSAHTATLVLGVNEAVLQSRSPGNQSSKTRYQVAICGDESFGARRKDFSHDFGIG